MPCYHPIDCWRLADGKGLTFSSMRGRDDSAPLQVPCGKCIGCQLDRARQWSARIMCEAQMAGPGRSHFVTLTLSPPALAALEEYEPARPRHSVWKPDVQRFMMRLRNRVGGGIKSFTGAEYGDQKSRPHYHLCLLHLDLPDLVPWSKSKSGAVLYRSPLIEEAWPFGHVDIGTLTPESAEYTARYALKKVPAAQRADRYGRSDDETGEVWSVQPEFALMSKGIGASWLAEFSGDCAGGFLLNSARRKVPLPRYFKDRLHEDVQARISANARDAAKAHAEDFHWRRMQDREEARHLKAALLARGLDQVSPVEHAAALPDAERDRFLAAFGLWTAEQREAAALSLLSFERSGRKARHVAAPASEGEGAHG